MEEESLSDIKNYLRKVKADDVPNFLSCNVQKPEELCGIVKRLIPEAEENKGLVIQSDCISMAMILGEYEAAERLVGELQNINLHISSTAVRFLSEPESVHISFANLLYSENMDVPQKLRFSILEKLNRDMFYGAVSGGGLIDINDIRGIDRSCVQKKLVNDYFRHPEYFEYHDDQGRIYEIPAACFLMKLYKNDPVKLRRLMSERIEITEEDYTDRKPEYIRIDIRMLIKAYEYEWMKQYRAKLYTLFITVYSFIEKACEDNMYYFVFPEEMEKIRQIRSELAGYISSLSIDEDDYLNSIEMTKKIGMSATVNSYAFGEALLGHKPKLIIGPKGGYSPESFFGFCAEIEDGEDDNDVKNNRKKCRLIRLAESISGIEYRIGDGTDLKKEIAAFLIINAKILRESFIVFAEKGLIPDAHIDYVTRRTNSHPNCAYMVPVLIMQKYGRLKSDA
ncbi:MAG: hypothetical protein K5770_09580 [Lachnospiraceae bacterium]|nr:hypothetical protein [Lachnospiraceae bacterium]